METQTAPQTEQAKSQTCPMKNVLPLIIFGVIMAIVGFVLKGAIEKYEKAAAEEVTTGAAGYGKHKKSAAQRTNKAPAAPTESSAPAP